MHISSVVFPKRKHSNNWHSIITTDTKRWTVNARCIRRKRRTGCAMHFWPYHSVRYTLGYVKEYFHAILQWFIHWKQFCGDEFPYERLFAESKFKEIDFCTVCFILCWVSRYHSHKLRMILQYHLPDLPILPALRSMHPLKHWKWVEFVILMVGRHLLKEISLQWSMTSGWKLYLCHWRATQHWSDWVWRYVWEWASIWNNCWMILEIEKLQCCEWSDKWRSNLWGIGEQQDIGKPVFDCEYNSSRNQWDRIWFEKQCFRSEAVADGITKALPHCSFQEFKYEVWATWNIPITATWFKFPQRDAMALTMVCKIFVKALHKTEVWPPCPFLYSFLPFPYHKEYSPLSQGLAELNVLPAIIAGAMNIPCLQRLSIEVHFFELFSLVALINWFSKAPDRRTNKLIATSSYPMLKNHTTLKKLHMVCMLF